MEWLPLVAPSVTVIMAVCAFIAFFMKREMRRLDDLPEAISQLSKAIDRLFRWKSVYTSKTDTELRLIKRSLRNMRKDQHALSDRLAALESRGEGDEQ